jgi:hypothetical protein
MQFTQPLTPLRPFMNAVSRDPSAFSLASPFCDPTRRHPPTRILSPESNAMEFTTQPDNSVNAMVGSNARSNSPSAAASGTWLHNANTAIETESQRHQRAQQRQNCSEQMGDFGFHDCPDLDMRFATRLFPAASVRCQNSSSESESFLILLM